VFCPYLQSVGVRLGAYCQSGSLDSPPLPQYPVLGVNIRLGFKGLSDESTLAYFQNEGFRQKSFITLDPSHDKAENRQECTTRVLNKFEHKFQTLLLLLLLA